MLEKMRVCVIGSGNIGSALAKIAAANCSKSDTFEDEVRMYVYEEVIDGRKLSAIINETHENVKYLPGSTLGVNVVAIPDIVETVSHADVVVFAMPQKYIKTVCAGLFGKVKHSAIGVSLVKGFDKTEIGSLELASRVIGCRLKIPTLVLTGLNFPADVAEDKFCEVTIGSKCKKANTILTEVFQTDSLRMVVVDDVETVELCNTLKTIVSCAAGIADGLGQGNNCKGVIFRIGLIEIVKFLDLFYYNARLSAVFESSGVSDLLISCFCGRERRVSEALVVSGKSLTDLEEELLNGRKLTGAQVAQDIYQFLRFRGLLDTFPFFCVVHRILSGDLPPEEMLNCVRANPEHDLRPQRLAW